MNKRIACMTDDEIAKLMAVGRVFRPHFRDRGGRSEPSVVIWSVLCPYCRDRHSPEKVDTCMVLPRKSVATPGSESSTSSAMDPGPLKQYSELWAFLTETTYPDGAKRRMGRLSLSCESGMLGLCLTDNETGTYAFLNGRNLEGLLTEAELRLADGSLSFRPSRKGK